MRDLTALRCILPILLLLAGCFQPARPAGPTDALAWRVSTALAGREQDALTYAGLYAVLAGRFDVGAYDSTSEAAAIAGRAGEILALPGALQQVVNEELNPLLGKPQPITPELADRAAGKLRALSDACRETAR